MVYPVYVTEDTFNRFEEGINSIQIRDTDTVDIKFFIDANDYASNTLHLRWLADDFSVRGVQFSRMEFKADYRYPTLTLERIGLYQQEGILELGGTYDLSAKKLHGTLSNTIVSTTALELLPTEIHDVLDNLDMPFEQLPLFNIDVGPCPAADALDHLAGNWSIRDVTFGGSTGEVLGGSLKGENDWLECSDRTGTLRGLEERAEETGSGMLGGPVSASVDFDSESHWFGVDADVDCDPTPVIGPLSSVRIATNVMHRLKFNGDAAPSGHLSLGSCVTNWSTFFIDIAMRGEEVTLHDAAFRFVGVPTAYSNSVLRIDPLTTRQGTNDLTGTISLNFKKHTAEVDLSTSMSPVTLHDAAYPPPRGFRGHHQNTGAHGHQGPGDDRLEIDEGDGFHRRNEGVRVDLPVAQLTAFSGTVLGNGPLLAVPNAQYSLFDGTGAGRLRWR